MTRLISFVRNINVLPIGKAKTGSVVGRRSILKQQSLFCHRVCRYNENFRLSRRLLNTKTTDKLENKGKNNVENDKDWKEPEKKSVTFEENNLTVSAQGGLTVTGWGHYKFKVNEDFILGSLILFPTFALSWSIETPNTIKDSRTYRPDDKFKNPMSINELSIDHFNLFEVYRPHQELIIIGTGSKLEYPKKDLLKELRKLANIEIMDTVNACATFNMLSQEGRRVAAALIAQPDPRG
mmetsp:Transcript_574/g.688  ORF Transcript_574/g.688 Transcript_574/m.688 type:complete len:238 (-) Transcript_574:1122-1835(-)|eukprot:CAMPEP_0204824192 /NCGR_PEP_ID=MMETSP1346-20131115/2227_1 /ASSEMBLY_ACC=CAM_ASM_000771 /TAXON_ID=215587 /ORGANISM="Aplanochytrium stocchinoi, Strain GSBS06" /LENGTH=237 /DNA_ID=CAMNT_0051951207 /DNA_START=124 /DNA_END=837 /DNA_ORIENTATION=+